MTPDLSKSQLRALPPPGLGQQPLHQSNGSTAVKILVLVFTAIFLLCVVLPAAYLGSSSWRRSRAYDAAEGQIIACPEKYDATVCDTMEFVQKHRGHAFRSVPKIRFLEDAELEQERRDGIPDDDPLLSEATALYKSLGLIGEDVNLIEVENGAGVSSILGYSELQSGDITLRGTDASDPFILETLAHELSHSYDTQWLNGSSLPLLLPSWLDDVDEKAFARLVVDEGTAEIVARDWLESQPAEVKALYAENAAEFDRQRISVYEGELPEVGGVAESGSSASYERYVSYPYEVGPGVVETLRAQVDNVDQLTIDPPETTERLLHPEVLAEDDPVVGVEAGGSDDVDFDGTLGELQLSYVLGPEAAEGWDGDSFSLWSEDGAPCISLTVAAENDVELSEMLEAAERWEQALSSRSAGEIFEDGRALLRMSNC